jgi:hypothetical protein
MKPNFCRYVEKKTCAVIPLLFSLKKYARNMKKKKWIELLREKFQFSIPWGVVFIIRDFSNVLYKSTVYVRVHTVRLHHQK